MAEACLPSSGKASALCWAACCPMPVPWSSLRLTQHVKWHTCRHSLPPRSGQQQKCATRPLTATPCPPGTCRRSRWRARWARARGTAAAAQEPGTQGPGVRLATVSRSPAAALQLSGWASASGPSRPPVESGSPLGNPHSWQQSHATRAAKCPAAASARANLHVLAPLAVVVEPVRDALPRRAVAALAAVRGDGCAWAGGGGGTCGGSGGARADASPVLFLECLASTAAGDASGHTCCAPPCSPAWPPVAASRGANTPRTLSPVNPQRREL